MAKYQSFPIPNLPPKHESFPKPALPNKHEDSKRPRPFQVSPPPGVPEQARPIEPGNGGRK